MAEGKIRWAFWPPGTDLSKVDSDDGIWIAGDADEGADTDLESEDEEGDSKPDGEDHQEHTGSDISEEEDDGMEGIQLGGRFGALAVEEEDGEGIEEDSEENE